MRFIITVIWIFLFLLSVSAQHKVNGQDEYTESVRLVKQSIKNPALAMGFSVTEKHINRLGDGVSIALLKIYDTDGLQNPQNIKNYLPIIRGAFDAPQIVELAENRKPEITMFLLTYLKEKITDENLKSQISDVIKYIREQTSVK